MSAVFPESMNKLNPEDISGSMSTLEEYIRYMCERVDFSTRNETHAQEGTAADVAAVNSRLNALSGEVQGKAGEAEVTALDDRVTAIEGVLSTSGPILYQNAQDITAADGETVYFTVKVIYSSTVTYAWQLRWGSDWTTPGFVGVNTDTMTVPATTSRNGYQFRCTITAGGFTIYSRTVTLHVT